MTKEASRPLRVADQIQRELGNLIVRDVADPRLEGIVVSGVDVSRDLAYAKVFVTVHDEAEAAVTLRVLARASGFLRHKLAERLRLRAMPQLRFIHDTTLDTANRIESLLEQAAADTASAEPESRPLRLDAKGR